MQATRHPFSKGAGREVRVFGKVTHKVLLLRRGSLKFSVFS